MGPRRERRGNKASSTGARAVFWLQWGRVVKDAEIRRCHAQLLFDPQASMGPRRERRGNTGLSEPLLRGPHASMGPRRERRGNLETQTERLIRH